MDQNCVSVLVAPLMQQSAIKKRQAHWSTGTAEAFSLAMGKSCRSVFFSLPVFHMVKRQHLFHSLRAWVHSWLTIASAVVLPLSSLFNSGLTKDTFPLLPHLEETEVDNQGKNLAALTLPFCSAIIQVLVLLISARDPPKLSLFILVLQSLT